MSFPALPELDILVNLWHFHNNSECYWEILTGISRNLCDADIHHFTTAASTKAVHSTFAESLSANAGIHDWSADDMPQVYFEKLQEVAWIKPRTW